MTFKVDWERWRLVRRTSERHERWIFSSCVNRPISNVITYFLLGTGVTPNHISIFTIFLGFLAFLSFIYGRFIFGGVLVQVASIVDGGDGEIARAKNLSSELGMIVDSLSDRLVEALLCAGVGYGVWRVKGSPYGLVFALVGLLGLFMDPYLAELVKARTGSPLHVATKLIEQKLRFSPADRGLRLFAVFVASILHYPEFGLLLVGATSLLYSTIKFAVWLKVSRAAQ